MFRINSMWDINDLFNMDNVCCVIFMGMNMNNHEDVVLTGELTKDILNLIL